jgi:hypothetical protein
VGTAELYSQPDILKKRKEKNMSKNPENPNRFTPDETSTFKCLFSKFCRQQINEENCTDDDCVTCCVSAAYDKIFDENEEEASDE